MRFAFTWPIKSLVVGMLVLATAGCAGKSASYVYDPAHVSNPERSARPDHQPAVTANQGSDAESGRGGWRWFGRSDTEERPVEAQMAAANAPSESEGRWGLLRSRTTESETPELDNLRSSPADMPEEINSLAPNAADGFGDDEVVLPTVSYRLRPGDPVLISLRGIPESANYEFMIDESGMINLPYIPPIRASGLTASGLQRVIRETYIEEQIYRNVTVNVMMPAQSYFVRGEVRQPGRYPLTTGMTVLQALAAAGGYTEFANPRRVEIIRGGETMVENARSMEQNPEQDFELKANDVIIVRRSIF